MSPPGTVRERSRQAFREAILEAAERVFGVRGYDGTRMADIAEAAGVATGTLYNYFHNKVAILQSLVETLTTAFLSELEQVAAAEPDPVDRLRALVTTAFRQLEGHRGTFTVFVELGVVSDTGMKRVCGASFEPTHQRILGVFERAIRDGIEAGRITRDIPAPDQVAFLQGAMNGAIFAWLTIDSGTSLVDRAGWLLDLYLNGAGVDV